MILPQWLDVGPVVNPSRLPCLWRWHLEVNLSAAAHAYWLLLITPLSFWQLRPSQCMQLSNDKQCGRHCAKEQKVTFCQRGQWSGDGAFLLNLNLCATSNSPFHPAGQADAVWNTSRSYLPRLICMPCRAKWAKCRARWREGQPTWFLTNQWAPQAQHEVSLFCAVATTMLIIGALPATTVLKLQKCENDIITPLLLFVPQANFSR